MVAITADEQDVYPPRVLVSVTGLTVGDTVDVYRVVAGERTELRAGFTYSVTETVFLVTDAELPFGVPVSYVAIINEAAEYTVGPTTYTLTGGKVALTDAITGAAAEVTIYAWDEKTRSRRASVFQVGGRNVVVSGDLAMFEGRITLYCPTDTARESALSLVSGATEGIVQIRQSGPHSGVDCYVAVLSIDERRWSQDGTDTRRMFTIQVAEVEGWSPELEAQGFTLQDIADVYDGLTLQDIANDYATLLDIAQGDFS